MTYMETKSEQKDSGSKATRCIALLKMEAEPVKFFILTWKMLSSDVRASPAALLSKLSVCPESCFYDPVPLQSRGTQRLFVVCRSCSKCMSKQRSWNPASENTIPEGNGALTSITVDKIRDFLLIVLK